MCSESFTRFDKYVRLKLNRRLSGTTLEDPLSKESKRRLFSHLRSEVPDEKIIRAMERVSREDFIDSKDRRVAYENSPLPIGSGQTISQPLMVAIMLSALGVRPTDKVLEIGTGSGYQTTILASLAKYVVTVERVPELASQARERLSHLDRKKIEVHLAGSQLGWPDCAPYDAIIVAAAAPRLPRILLAQLADQGRLVVPVGSLQSQELMKATRRDDEYVFQTLGGCRFVPLVGRDAWSVEETVDFRE